MNKSIIKQILIIPVVIWMIVVFEFSSESADISGNTSLNVTRKIAQVIISKDLTEEQKNENIEVLDSVIRKVAHFTLYTIGGFLGLLYINIYEIDDKKKIGYSVIAGFVYSVSDEIHQIFVPGRAGMITGVIIDTMGVATGVCVCLLIIKVINILIGKYVLKNKISIKSKNK